MIRPSLDELYEFALRAKTKSQAEQSLRAIVDRIVMADIAPVRAKEIALENIGYFAGYYSREDMERIYSLFDTEHPILGRRPWELSPEQVFQIGLTVGERLKRRKSIAD